MNRIIAQAYPNGEVRVVFCPSAPVRPFTWEEAEGCAVAATEPLGDEIGSPVRTPLSLGPNSEPEVQAHPQGVPELRPGFGGTPRRTVFGNNARRTLLRAGGALEREGYPKERTLFLTGTLPGSTESAMVALQNFSSYAVDLLKSKLSKLGCSHALSMYCWELQQRGALHIHYCLVVGSEELAERVIAEWKKMWTQVIDAIGRKAGIDMWERIEGGTWANQKEILRADAQRVEKSVGSYLSKYLSKDANPRFLKAFGSCMFRGPVRWWGVSRPLLALIARHSRRLEVDAISVYKIRHIREEIRSLLDGMDDKVREYSDKAKSCLVFVAYSVEEHKHVYNSIAQLIATRFQKMDDRINIFPDGDNSKGHVNSGSLSDIPLEVVQAGVNEGHARGDNGLSDDGDEGHCVQLDLLPLQWQFRG